MNTRSISLSSNEKIGLITNLATMLSAGIPIMEAVDSALQDTKGHPKKILETLKLDLMQGKHVFESFSAFPNAFDSVTINLLRAAEEAGTLETTLIDLRDHIQKESEFIDKIKLAMVYPFVIGLVFAGVMLMILVVVVPKISTVFSRLRVPLPLPTKIMIFVSDLLIHQTLWLGLGLITFFTVFIFLYHRNRRLVLNILFTLPVVSGVIKAVDLTRFTRTLHLLLSSGIPIDSALLLCQKVVVRSSTSRVIARSRDMVLSGKKLAEGLRTEKGTIPGIMIKLVEAGEKSGSLDKSMSDIATHLDYQVSNSIKTLASVMEPVMLLVVGVCVGGMMLAIIAPIYGLISQVGNR